MLVYRSRRVVSSRRLIGRTTSQYFSYPYLWKCKPKFCTLIWNWNVFFSYKNWGFLHSKKKNMCTNSTSNLYLGINPISVAHKDSFKKLKIFCVALIYSQIFLSVNLQGKAIYEVASGSNCFLFWFKNSFIPSQFSGCWKLKFMSPE